MLQEKIASLLSQLTLEEKAALCSGSDFWHLQGIPRLNIPPIMITDGPHGLRKQAGSSEVIGLSNSHPATCFPPAVTLASSWDRNLLRRVGKAIGRECRQQQVGAILGPGANIKRSPLCGRNFEYFSEDPLLSGECAAAHIQGVQETGTAACLKHFAVNNQETRRMTIDAVVDDRALHEIYLTGFEIAVRKGQPRLVMSAYNRLNGIYCSENRWLLTDILRRRWQYEGAIVTDWGALDQRIAALQAGLELEMPGSDGQNDRKIMTAVKNGDLAEDTLNQAVSRILTVILTAAETLAEPLPADYDRHHRLAREAAAAGAVLLKNEQDILPLSGRGSIGLLGRFARHPRYQGSGSSLINPTRLDNLHDALRTAVNQAQTIRYAAGYPDRGEESDAALLAEAVAVAQEVETAVVCVGLPDLFEIEALDRPHMRLPRSHDELVRAVAAVNPRTVVLLSNGAPVEMRWIDQVPAVLETYLGGQAGGAATADMLTGSVNPGGKLAETFPRTLEDCPAAPHFPGGPLTAEYRESIYVGYRYYDRAVVNPLFPFGHGLSYTTFTYANLQLSSSSMQADEILTISLDITNSGGRSGAEIVQLYVQDADSTPFRPAKELRDFAKIHLAPEETKTVTFELTKRAFAFFDPAADDWRVETGEFHILIGASSRDIRLRGSVNVHGRRLEPLSAARKNQLAPYYAPDTQFPADDASFAALLGRPLPKSNLDSKAKITRNTPMMDLQHKRRGRLLLSLMRRLARISVKEADESSTTAIMIERTMQEIPLRALRAYSNGVVSSGMLDATITMLNGHFLRGLRELFRALRARKEV